MSIRGTDEAKVEEDLVEVDDRLFVTTVEDHDATHDISQIQCDCHIAIVLSLTMQWRISIYCYLRYARRGCSLNN